MSVDASLPPELEPVRFDVAAAAAAIDACARAAAIVDQVLLERAAAAAVARDEWRGPFRRRFDDNLAALDGEAVALVEDLRRTAAAIVAAADRARAMNASRREARALWQRTQLAS